MVSGKGWYRVGLSFAAMWAEQFPDLDFGRLLCWEYVEDLLGTVGGYEDGRCASGSGIVVSGPNDLAMQIANIAILIVGERLFFLSLQLCDSYIVITRALWKGIVRTKDGHQPLKYGAVSAASLLRALKFIRHVAPISLTVPHSGLDELAASQQLRDLTSSAEPLFRVFRAMSNLRWTIPCRQSDISDSVWAVPPVTVVTLVPSGLQRMTREFLTLLNFALIVAGTHCFSWPSPILYVAAFNLQISLFQHWHQDTHQTFSVYTMEYLFVSHQSWHHRYPHMQYLHSLRVQLICQHLDSQPSNVPKHDTLLVCL